MSACGDWLSPSIRFSSNWHRGGRCGATHTYSSLFPYLHFAKIWIGCCSGPTHLPYFEQDREERKQKLADFFTVTVVRRFSYSPASTDQIQNNKIFVALSNLWWCISRNWVGNQTSFHSVMVISSACLVISTPNTEGSPNCVHHESGVVNKVCRRSSISFIHVSIWYLFFELHQTTHQSNIGVQLGRKVTELYPQTLIVEMINSKEHLCMYSLMWWEIEQLTVLWLSLLSYYN